MNLKDQKCQGQVSGNWHSYKCGAKAKFFEDGKYWCGRHAPARWRHSATNTPRNSIDGRRLGRHP